MYIEIIYPKNGSFSSIFLFLKPSPKAFSVKQSNLLHETVEERRGSWSPEYNLVNSKRW